MRSVLRYTTAPEIPFSAEPIHSSGMHKIAPVIAVVVLLLPPLYYGAYWLALDHDAWANTGQLTWPLLEYRVGGKAAELVFWPAHQIDRKLRPKHWEVTYW